MDDHGAILCQISHLKDMLDQVNAEMEESIKVTRDIESEIDKCSEIESVLTARESELTKTAYMLSFELRGLVTVAADSRASVKHLEEELCRLQTRRDKILKQMDDKREEFTTSCLDFQMKIGEGSKDMLGDLLLEKESLENEILNLSKRNDALQNSTSAFVEEILEDLHRSNSVLQVELDSKKKENSKLLEDIDELKRTLLSAISME